MATADEDSRGNNKDLNFKTNVVKITSRDKAFLDQFFEYLKLAFDCEVTSPKMYNDEKDIFFQYASVEKRRA